MKQCSNVMNRDINFIEIAFISLERDRNLSKVSYWGGRCGGSSQITMGHLELIMQGVLALLPRSGQKPMPIGNGSEWTNEMGIQSLVIIGNSKTVILHMENNLGQRDHPWGQFSLGIGKACSLHAFFYHVLHECNKDVDHWTTKPPIRTKWEGRRCQLFCSLLICMYCRTLRILSVYYRIYSFNFQIYYRIYSFKGLWAFLYKDATISKSWACRRNGYGFYSS